MWADSGSSTIGARVPSKSSPTTVVSATATSAAYRRSASDEVKRTDLTLSRPVHPYAERPRAAGGRRQWAGASGPVRITVSRSSRIGLTAGILRRMPRSSDS